MSSDNDYEAALSGWFARRPVADDDEGALGPRKDGAELLAAIERVQESVRRRFSLAPEVAVMVSEVACNLPGCPPLETVVAFWENEQRFHFKLFKQVKEVGFDDLPYAWMKESLIVPEGFGCECC